MMLRITYPSDGPTFGLIFEKGRVVDAPNVAAFMLGKPQRYVEWYYTKRHCTVEEMP